jgi:hypothetical protein
MNPKEFANTIYLGDRGCEEIIIDTIKSLVRIKIDLISRIRSPDGQWNYYQDENIENGYIVFCGINSFKINSNGLLPNDFIISLEVEPFNEEDDSWKSSFKVVGMHGMDSEEVELSMIFSTMHIETHDGICIYS